jgi:hypothetical protein
MAGGCGVTAVEGDSGKGAGERWRAQREKRREGVVGLLQGPHRRWGGDCKSSDVPWRPLPAPYGYLKH